MLSMSVIGPDIALNLCNEIIANSGDIEVIKAKVLDVSFGVSVFLIQEFLYIVFLYSH